MALNCVVVFTAWLFPLLPCFTAGNKCKSELISSINVTTELQSDVLLPCIFEPTLLGSDKSADIAAVWSQRDITIDNLVEIKLQGEVSFWSNRGGRITPFPKLSESGNFSLLLRNVQRSDLGLYRCELFEGINCSIAYQEIHLIPGTELVTDGFLSWPITAGALGGVIFLLSLLIISCFCAKRSRSSSDKKVCSKVQLSDPMHRAAKYTLDNPIYDTFIQPELNSSAREKEGISPDAPVYAVIKKGKRAPKEINQTAEVLHNSHTNFSMQG